MDARTKWTVVILAFFLGLAGIQAVIVERWLALDGERDRQAQIKQSVLRLERMVADVDNGFRGYVLMKQSTFLRPMITAEASIPRIIEGLGQMTEAWPDLRGRIQVIDDRVTELLNTKRRLTMEMANGKEEAVLSYVRGGDGVALAQTITLAFQDFGRKLNERQREWDRDMAQSIAWVRWGVPATAMGGIAGGFGLGRLIGRSHRSARAADSPAGAHRAIEARQDI
ncbi:MAG: CHASE3 domain-containing protein [Nitrospira sp.]|nr:CHASE3 domain-containing protein [Nitrospira sp.]